MSTKMYAIRADYRPKNYGNWYYVLANSKVEARRKFSNTISWLDIREVVQVVDDEFAKTVIERPYSYILLR